RCPGFDLGLIRPPRLDRNQPVGITIRQIAEHESVDHRENSGVPTDTERQRSHRDRRKAWIPTEKSNSIANVPPGACHAADTISRNRIRRALGSVDSLSQFFPVANLQFRTTQSTIVAISACNRVGIRLLQLKRQFRDNLRFALRPDMQFAKPTPDKYWPIRH